MVGGEPGVHASQRWICLSIVVVAVAAADALVASSVARAQAPVVVQPTPSPGPTLRSPVLVTPGHPSAPIAPSPPPVVRADAVPVPLCPSGVPCPPPCPPGALCPPPPCVCGAAPLVDGVVVMNGTVPSDTVQYGTVQYGTVQYGTVQYGTVQYGTVQYGTVPSDTVQNGIVQYGTAGEAAPSSPAPGTFGVGYVGTFDGTDVLHGGAMRFTAHLDDVWFLDLVLGGQGASTAIRDIGEGFFLIGPRVAAPLVTPNLRVYGVLDLGFVARSLGNRNTWGVFTSQLGGGLELGGELDTNWAIGGYVDVRAEVRVPFERESASFGVLWSAGLALLWF